MSQSNTTTNNNTNNTATTSKETKQFMSTHADDININLDTVERVGYHKNFVMLAVKFGTKQRRAKRIRITTATLNKIINKEKIAQQ